MAEHTNKSVLAWVLTISMMIWANLLPAQEKPSAEKIRITVATSSLAFLVPFVAKDRGFYLKTGSDVELIQMRPNIAMAALMSGDIDYVELIGSVIRSAARNLPVRAISTGIKAPFFSIVAQTKYKSIKDLKGTVIGVASIGGTNQISTRITLKQFGLDPDKDIKFLAIGDEKVMYDAFKFGRVESIAIAPPFSVQLKREGYPLLANTADHVVIPFSGLGATTERIKSNRAQVKRILRAEIEALRYIQTNAAETAEVIRKRFSMDEKLAWESYDVVVEAFSRDGRVPLEGVEILLGIEKAANQIPQNVTAEMVVDNTLVDETLKELAR